MKACIILVFILFSCTSLRDEDIAHLLSSIELEVPQSTIEEYEFMNHLQILLNANTNTEKRYRLKVSFLKTNNPIVIQSETDTTRHTIILAVNFQLFYQDIATGVSKETCIWAQAFKQITSYNTVFSPYSTDVLIQQTEVDLYRTSAEEIKRRLVMFLRQKQIK